MSNQAKTRYEQKGIAMTCRSFQEYLDMFELKEEDFQGPVLDVAAGASSFTRTLNEKGYAAIAVDPLYQHSPEALKELGIKEIEESTRKLDEVSHLYHWEYYQSPENHSGNRKWTLPLFIEDFNRDSHRERYVAGSLPSLPFASETFSLILCNHFLFLYEEQFNLDFHVAAIQELLRVCQKGGEVRIYPLVGFDGKRYVQLNDLQKRLEHQGVDVSYENTDFRFLKEATQILKLRK
ncbi:MAG TPA: class I SAM-dependent methyltransferase [Bacillales bacterium]|nr:class I SAM-dependent methyltransferase [Bacillales bacterium]